MCANHALKQINSSLIFKEDVHQDGMQFQKKKIQPVNLFYVVKDLWVVGKLRHAKREINHPK